VYKILFLLLIFVSESKADPTYAIFCSVTAKSTTVAEVNCESPPNLYTMRYLVLKELDIKIPIEASSASRFYIETNLDALFSALPTFQFIPKSDDQAIINTTRISYDYKSLADIKKEFSEKGSEKDPLKDHLEEVKKYARQYKKELDEKNSFTGALKRFFE
jgi:hypothetical protein